MIQSKPPVVNETAPTGLSDPIAERDLLSAMIFQPDLIGTLTVKPDDFLDADFRPILRALQRLHQESISITVPAIAEELRSFDAAPGVSAFDAIGGTSTLGPLCRAAVENGPIHLRHIQFNADRVMDLGTRRRIAEFGHRVAEIASNGRPTGELLAFVQEQARSLTPTATEGATDGRFRIHVQTSAELDAAEYQTEYFIPYLFAKNEPAMVAAPQKSLKTSLMGADLLLSISWGERFAGYFDAGDPHRVLFMSGESGFCTLQETARRICASKGRELRDAANMLWSEQLPQFGNVAHIEETRRVIRDHGIELLAIDPCYLSMPGADAGNLFIQGAMMRDMAAMVREERCSLLLIHHTKNVPAQRIHAPLELSDIAWAGFQEFARQWFLINRRKPYDPDSNGEHSLWLNVGSSAGHGGLWGVDIVEGRRSPTTTRFWDIAVCKGSEARQSLVEESLSERASKQEQTRAAAVQLAYDKILSAFVHFPDGATKRRVRDRIGQLKSFDEAWAKACNSGELVECRVKADNGQEYDGFKREYAPDR